MTTSKKFIPVARPSLGVRELEYVSDAVKSGWVSSIGSYVDRFERDFARFCGTQYAIVTSNGTVALHLAMLACGIQAGDEVIVPDLTFIATPNAVCYLGARPVFVDVDADTLCLDPAKLFEAITDRTRAIIAVHLYGHPANMPEINRIAQSAGLLVIEDAAEAHGARVGAKRVGSLGHCGVFSFYGNKIVTTGEGGAITTDNSAINQRARYLRDQAMSESKRYWHTELGYNYRITNLQAALGVAQLERVEEFLNKRREIFEQYRDRLKPNPRIALNRKAAWAENVYWTLCAEIAGASRETRDSLISCLRERGIDSRPYFYPCSEMPMYQSAKRRTPVAAQASSVGLNLPFFADITDDEVGTVCSVVNELVN